jgi:hypothetical protein
VNESDSQLQIFLSRAQMRWTLLRIVESIGISTLIASGAAMVLSPILLMRGQPSMALALTLLIACVPVGLIVGLIRRPSRTATALEADRQFDLADLLATAMSVQKNENVDSWHTAIIAVAERRCAALSPNTLVLNHLGVRAWGGIGLSCAIALTLGLFASSPSSSTAQPRADELTSMTPFESPDQSSPAMQINSSSQFATPVDANPNESEDSQRSSDTESQSKADRSSQNALGSQTAGSGAGRSQTDSKSTAPLRSSQNVSSEDRRGDVAASGSSSSRDAVGSDAVTGGSVSPRNLNAAPWRSTELESDSDRTAGKSLDPALPDQYRDLVRSYFDPANSR